MWNAIKPTYVPRNRLLGDLADSILDRWGRFDTDDLASAQRHLREQDDSIGLSVAADSSFRRYRESVVRLGRIILSVGSIDARGGYSLSYCSRDEYLVSIPLRGSGWVANGDQTLEVGEEDLLLVSPCCRVAKHWYGPGEVLSLNIPVNLVHRHVAEGSDHTQGLDLPPIAKLGRRQMRGLLRFLDMIGRELADTSVSPFLQAPMVEQVEAMLLSLLVAPLPRRGRPLTTAASPAIPYYVRRAEEYILANAHGDISIEELAAASGVSARSLQYGFKKYRDTTPMLYLKRLRYERARAALLAGDGVRRRVSEIAADIGYANVSQFSRDYKAMFGESPSQTASGARTLVA